MVSAFTTGKDGLPQVNKDPNAALDYTIDWADWLGADVIAASTWTVASPAGGLASATPSFTNTTAKTWLSGGTAGQVVRVTNRITTSLGRIDDRSFNVRLVER
jgi:hypothetical protein